MAQDIVGGLFGMTPEAYQQGMNRRDTAANLTAAQLTPGQLAGYYAMQAGTGLGRAAQGLLGVEDPELMKIRDVQSMRGQFDTSTPKGLREFAAALAPKYPDLAVQAATKAADIDKTIAEAEAKRTEKIKQVGLTTDGRQVYQSGASQFVLTEQGPQPYYGKLESKQTKTEITGLDKVFDKAFTIAEGKDQAEAWKTAGIAYQDASKVNRNLREMESVVGSAFVGPYGSLKAGVSRVFGGGKRLSDTEVLDALSAELVIPMAKLFPGSLAVKELQELIKTKPNVSQSEPTILRLINKIQQDVKAAEITYEAGERYRAKNEGKIQGFNPNIANNRATRFVEIEQKLKKNRATNPNYMLSAEETKEAEKIATELGLK
jgi:hypothetical protein